MAIKDFIPLGDVKNTVEKAVKEKPKFEDLIRVESPGKPTPALNLEESYEEKPKKIRKKKATSNPSTIRKSNAVLIITEKPQAAQKIANALGDAKKYSEDNVSYYEIEKDGKIIYIASAVGHLFNLTYVKGQKGWPVFELVWEPSFKNKTSAFTKRYYDLLKKLATKSSEFIIATDYDVEGEVIGWNVLRFICNQKTAKRMKYSTLTSEELLYSFNNTEKEPNWGNAYAGESRHIIDWLYGINLSRALMSAIKTSGSFKILSIGRVQGPALKIIVDREKEISNFKPEPYWQVFALTKNPEKEEELEFKHPKDIFDKKELEKFDNINEALASTEKKEELTPPPSPFDLTTLQREAYRFLKFSPSQTLQLAQKLYLDGIISYPRTSSQKIPDAIKPLEILKKLSKIFKETKLATRKKPIEGIKSDPAHPSIYPTGEIKKLPEQEEKLCNLIAKRFISCFCPDLKTANKRIVLTSTSPKTKEEVKFTASGSIILDKGWSAVYPSSLEEAHLPDLSGKVKINKIDIKEKETQPPSRYTPASLVTLLEKKNLGTKATRSMIVDTLFSRGYLDGKSIQATPLGIRLVDTLDKHSSIIIDENLTRSLEEEMEKIQESKSDFEKNSKEIVEKAKKIISDIAKEFKSKEKEIGQDLSSGLQDLRKEQNEQNELIICPTCKQGKLRILFNRKSRRYFVACSAYPNCKQTYSLPPNALIKRAENKICPADNFPKLLAIRKAKRPWEFCFNPECPIEKEKRAL
jgi:DNA topoisomerase-1